MRILFLTNFYPPAGRGGYEQWCQEVAEDLDSLGHKVIVLTSDYGEAALQDPEPDWVHRELHMEMELDVTLNSIYFFTKRKGRESENLDKLRDVVASFMPNVGLIWGMWNLPRSLPALAEQLLPGRIAYYMSDYWPTLPNQFEVYWQVPARNWATRIPKYLLRPIARRILAEDEQPAVRFEHVMFPTAFMSAELKRRGVSPENSEIVYGAVDTGQYQYRGIKSGIPKTEDVSMLYIGRLTAEKGVHTAIEAVKYLVQEQDFSQLHLTIAGSGDPEYEAYLHQLARQAEVESLVTFLGSQPKELMPALYQRADIFLFTSIWLEPFGRVLIEAMASGVAVIGSATGGAAEILVDNENALFFEPGDDVGLANQILRLVKSPSLRQRLIETGHQTAVTKFDITRMTTEIEAYLQTVAS